VSVPASPRPAKLLVGFFLTDQQIAGTLMERLEAHFGPVDLVSRWLPFDFTDYYTREMGTPLYRRMVAFKRLVDQEALPDIKHLTNALEIYLRRGIYADLTLMYRKGQFQSLPWTYPDYKDEHLQDFLLKVRNKYALDLKTDESVRE